MLGGCSDTILDQRDTNMDDRSKADAFNAIHDVAIELLKLGLSSEADEKVHLIISLTRYQYDVRTAGEKPTVDEQAEQNRETLFGDGPGWTTDPS
jgi:hypothetical protein